MITLSRLSITGDINADTPIVVIKEIIESHGLIYDQNYSERRINYLLNEIKAHPITINKLYQLPDYRLLARFINPNRKLRWSKSTLEAAHEFLCSTDHSLSKDFINGYIGLQTPTHVKSYNSCLLYRFCRDNGITLNSNSTLEQMALALILLSCSKGQLISYLSHVITDNNNDGIIPTIISSIYNRTNDSSILTQIMNPNRKYIPRSRNLKDAYDNLTGNNSIDRDNYIPKDDDEAAILIAHKYQIDISNDDPLRIYYGITSDDFNHSSDDLDKYNKLSQEYNYLLPQELYNNNDLIAMARREGFNDEEININGPANLLQSSLIINNFYEKVDVIRNQRTLISLDQVSAIDKQELVYYGIKDQSMLALSLGELDGLFKSQQNFNNPLPGYSKPFDRRSIIKLKLICQMRNTEISNRLIETIIGVETTLMNNIKEYNEFHKLYLEQNDTIKECIQETVKILFDLGMYMRGWMGPNHPYPLIHPQITDQDIIDQRVCIHISSFYEKCNNLKDIGDQILCLPLSRYNQGTFTKAIDKEAGITIGERLKVIRGNNTDNINSCIKLASNWFIPTSYLVGKSVDVDFPININEIKEVCD